MRITLALAATLTLVLLGARPALASCAPPRTLTENAASAAAVVHARILSVQGSALTVAAIRTLKGTVPTTFTVYAGPGRGNVYTSVDYSGEPGTEHVLYLTRVPDGWETNACLGSHAGGPTTDERTHFGVSAQPSPAPNSGSSAAPERTILPDVVDPASAPNLVVALAATALLLAAAIFLLARRRARPA